MKENQRTRLTKRLLKDAMINILQSTPLSKITITEICSTAEINRTTFYKHYTDENALFSDIERDVIELLQTKIASNNVNSLEEVLKFFSDNKKLSNVLFIGNADDKFSEKIFSLPEISKVLQMKKKQDFSEAESLGLRCFIYHGGYALISEWVKNDYPVSAEELADFIMKSVYKILS